MKVPLEGMPVPLGVPGFGGAGQAGGGPALCRLVSRLRGRCFSAF